MIIRMNTDQIKKIRDDAFEAAANIVIDAGTAYSIPDTAKRMAAEIRAMKNSPVNVLAKGKC